jgi:hypothetical protein
MIKNSSTICCFIYWPPVDRTEWAVERGICDTPEKQEEQPVQAASVKV